MTDTDFQNICNLGLSTSAISNQSKPENEIGVSKVFRGKNKNK